MCGSCSCLFSFEETFYLGSHFISDTMSGFKLIERLYGQRHTHQYTEWGLMKAGVGNFASAARNYFYWLFKKWWPRAVAM